MNWFAKLQIAKKLSVMVASVILLFSILSGIILWSSLTEVMGKDLDARGNSVAAEIANFSSEPIQRGDLLALDELIYMTKNSNNFVDYIFILDKQQRIMAHTFRSGIPKNLLNSHVVGTFQEEMADVIVLKTDQGVIHDLLYPIEYGELGYVRVGINEKSLSFLLWNNILKLICITLFVGLLGAVFVFKLTNIFTRPLKKLIHRAEEISEGNFTRQLTIYSDDEFGKLTTAMNTMAMHLDESELERKRLLEHLLTAQEDERKRISLELHDESGQALTALMLSMRALANETDDEENKAYIMAVRDETAHILQKLRNLAVELRPPALDELGIVAAIEKLIADYQKYHKIHITFSYKFNLSPASITSLAIYRIVQESLTNIVKHAQASEVMIALFGEKEIELVIKDNGVGLTQEDILQARRTNHLGLYGIQERVRILGGRMKIAQEAPKWSTVFYIWLKLNQEGDKKFDKCNDC